MQEQREALDAKESVCDAGEPGLIPESEDLWRMEGLPTSSTSSGGI